MNKKEVFDEFIKLNKTEKEQLTLKWLCELVKTENLSIQDVMDILNCVDSSFSRTDKLNSLVYNGTITAVSVSRILGYGYAKSMNYINNLLKKNIIVKIDNCYKILDKEQFKHATDELLKGENCGRNNKK